MTQATAPDLAGLQARAAARLAELGLPHAKLEEWRFANPAAITKRPWRVAPGEPGATAAADLGAWPRHEAALVAGRFVAAPGAAPLPAGVRLESLAAAARATPEAVFPLLGAIATSDVPWATFVTQNTALFPDGAYLAVPAGVAVAAPVVLRHGGGTDATLVPGRVLVDVGAGASLLLVEDLRGAAGGGFLNAVTELALGAGARCTIVRLVEQDGAGSHVASTWGRAAEGASFHALTFALGGTFVRDDVHVRFAGPGAEASLDGLFVVAGRETIDHHTMLDHAVPACTSRELYKGVLAGAGRGVFNGAVVIRPDAQKSDSGQRNPNLLLSDDATIHTKPELQIHADDVKCAHGATVGQLDADALFYLRARGIDAEAARALLVHAFAREVVERVPHAGLREDVDRRVEERMARLAGEVA